MRKLLTLVVGLALIASANFAAAADPAPVSVPAAAAGGAAEVKFKGTTAPIGVNVRSGATTKSSVLYTIAGNTEVQFDGWEEGEAQQDYWTGQSDTRWFYFYKNNAKHYISSAFIFGNPPDPGTPKPPKPPGTGATVPDVKQKMSNWCWAGVSVPILQHYGKTVTQEEFVRYVKGGLYNDPATTGEIKYGLKRYGVNSSDFYNLPTLQWVKNEVDGRRPMVAFIRWTHGAAIGHFVVLDGYYTGTGGNQYVSYMDPWYGDHYSQTFDSFKSNNRFVWRGTISTSN